VPKEGVKTGIQLQRIEWIDKTGGLGPNHRRQASSKNVDSLNKQMTSSITNIL
jgi:hypothetical protein